LLALLQQLNAKLDQPSRAYLVANENYLNTHNEASSRFNNFLNRING